MPSSISGLSLALKRTISTNKQLVNYKYSVLKNDATPDELQDLKWESTNQKITVIEKNN